MIGSLHELKQGHAALASDLMEQFRIPIVDQLVLRLLTRGQIIPDEFEQQGEQCRLTDESRKFFLIAFEKRMQTIIKHPRTGRSMSYRRSIEQQIDHYIDVLHHPGMAYPAFEIR